VALPAVVVGLAATRPGYPVEAVDLTDASVWVVNLSAAGPKAARYNQPIEELTGGFGIDPEAGQFDLAQAAEHVAIVQAAGFRVVDPVAMRLGQTTAYPGGQGGLVAVGGQAALLVDSAARQAWLRPFEAIADLDTAAEPADFDPGGGRAVIAPDGTAFAVTPQGQVIRAALAGGAALPEVRQIGRTAAPSGQIKAVSAVGDRVQVLAGTTLYWQGGSVDLGKYGDEDSLQLQTPGADLGWVAIATRQALLLVSPRGEVAQLATGNPGAPAVPVAAGGCVHAAWAAGPAGGDNYIAACQGAPPARRALAGVAADSQLVLRANRQVVVLNDVADGRVWMPQQDSQVRDKLNWDQIDPEPHPGADQADAPGSDQRLDCDDKAAKPAAQDDEFGFRPGQSLVLAVLRNDSATGCGALGIDRIDGLEAAWGSAQVVLAGRAIQFAPAEGAQRASFVYTVSDANGQTSSATVTLQAREGANTAPVAPAQELRLAAEYGATASYNALAGFADPEGDALVLEAARSDDPSLRLTSGPDGWLTIRKDSAAPGAGAGVVWLTVRDQLGAAAAPTPLTVAFAAPGSLVPAADPVKAEGLVGEAVRLDLRAALRAFPAAAPSFALDGQLDPLTRLEIDQDSGVAEFWASAANTYLLAITVTAAGGTGRLAARVDVREASQPRVVAVGDTAYLRPGGATAVDPLLNDWAEGGGVKVLQDFDLSQAPGVEAVPVAGQFLELSGAGEGAIGYTVSAGGATAQGWIRVVQAGAGPNQDPVVAPRRLTVRAGGVVTIPVLDQASDPDGDQLAIDAAQMAQPSPACGRLYASEQSVRYAAPEDGCPSPVEVAVAVLDGAGGSALGIFTIAVHTSRGAAKPPPAPLDLTARVLQGQTVRIAVPLTGIDVDGDGVSLQQGLDQPPAAGQVSEVGPDYITYQAEADQPPGTVTFAYAVEDWASNRATATVAVGVGVRAEAAGVVARDDAVTARPLKVLEIPVLANDVDLAGQGGLTFCAGQALGLSWPQLAAEADPASGRLVVAMPQAAGHYQVVYQACGASGNRDSATLDLTVDPDAPVRPPQAKDIVSPPQATIDKASVDIDVMRWAYNPSGPSQDLELFLPAGAEAHATLKSASEITVRLRQDLPVIVFYGVRNTSPEGGGRVAYGSVAVPPISRPPYLRPALEPVKAEAGREIAIALDEFVAVAKGRQGAFLYQGAGAGAPTAGHGQVAGAPGGRAIRYTPQARHQGPDRIEFWVADTAEAADPALKRSKLWLDVVVAPKGQVALAYQDPGPQVERGGGSRTLDLADFTTADGRALDQPGRLAVSLGQPTLDGLEVSQSGSKVTIEAGTGVKPGDRGSIPLALAYDGGEPAAGLKISFTVVETKQPDVKPKVAGPVKVEVGQPKAVPVLAGVYDPWAKQEPARVGGVSVAGPAAAWAQGQSITVVAAAPSQPVVVSFEVEDAVGRLQAGSFEVVARAAPEAPSQVRASPGGAGQAVVSWAPVVGARAGGEPVTSYRVRLAGAEGPLGEGCPEAAPPAASVVCDMGAAAYGQIVAVEVTAANAVGESPPGLGQLDYDVAPDPPQPLGAEAGKNSVQLAWRPAANSRGAVTSYHVACGDAAPLDLPANAASATVTGLAPGQPYLCEVAAQGRKGRGAAAQFPPATPWGQIGAPEAPQIRRLSASQVEVSWAKLADERNAAVTYLLERDAAPVSACPASPCVLDLPVGAEISLRLRATSAKAGVEDQVSAAAGPLRQAPDAAPPPGPVAAAQAGGAPAAGAGAIEVAWPAAPAVDGHEAVWAYQWSGGALAGPQTRFDNLAAGVYHFAASYCLASQGGLPWVAPAPAALCAGAAGASVNLTTKPAQVEGCRATRLSASQVEVAGCAVADAGGLPAALAYQLPGGGAATAGAMGAFRLEVAGGAGHLEVWAVNDLGASPRLEVAYSAYQPAAGLARPAAAVAWSNAAGAGAQARQARPAGPGP
jgi:hypothetical protein